MPFIDQLLERAAVAAGPSGSLVASAATTFPSAAVESLPPTGTLLPTPSSTGNIPSSTTTNSSSNSGSSGSSPLLFFVALGFGVVFTNLWIIVGVKYCFRYNARARQMRLAAEDGEPINMDNIPPHPRRRRREKKLMSIDEVNEKFPMLKYKTWVSSRAMEGLSTRGGVDAPSRANSIRSVAGALAPVTESPQPDTTTIATTITATTTTMTADTDATPTAQKSPDVTTTAVPAVPAAPAAVATSATAAGTSATAATAATAATPDAARESTDAKAPDMGMSDYNKGRTSDEHSHHSDDDDDEHIDSALPPECVGTSGDTCAICIDTLEDDDDVRGLTCGHAFHAVCLDPWLTSRRACCPLCKADYYTPKPREPPVEAGADPNAPNPLLPGAMPDAGFAAQSRLNNIARPVTSWSGLRGPSSYLQNRLMASRGSRGRQHDAGAMDSRPAMPPAASPATASRLGWVSNFRPFRRRQDESGSSATATATPAQLEAGVRP